MAQNDKNQIVRKKMLDLHNVRVGKVPQDSQWLRSIRLHFTQDGRSKTWDVIRIHDSVSIIVFNTTRRKLVFVRQFRPAVYYASLPEKQDVVDVERYPATLGLSLELCAGIVDKDKPLVEIAREELKEECGYEAPTSAFEQITTYLSSASASAKQTIFYVQVTDSMRIYPGGGDESEGEIIEVVELSIPELKDYIKSKQVQSPVSFLYGVSWFLLNKSEYC
ncbi:uridine diphosphate glucose pyrophosphatase NUDT14-like [Monomorium pharaonis]|uniref:uridine diphosphate glucose pyrophosphatase NUDT14 n=1 Tax=Monomorium pharaonis TaxID=307658 RepID=UPI00063FBFA7|nr:uridine diphosphate glucose pyrophosphatase NUDT14 [Monomorium pharaonis]XP_036150362.1 uridine diphosphate glucose pyrophosphatase NUDT14-like [Monomorium pharaonis]XP_036150882.1 uridine diphosphate glucose pyrophosphatase NUDT14-like [Monomorium pharaonis]